MLPALLTAGMRRSKANRRKAVLFMVSPFGIFFEISA
jgi:hypothetical protein